MSNTVPDYSTPEEVRQYFETCRAYWFRQGDSPAVAACKAFWWDCVEIWNLSGWNQAKESFALSWRGYRPGSPVPEASRVETGNA